MLKALDRLAAKTDHSRNAPVSRSVEDFVALSAWQIDKIEAGLEAAHRDDFASDNELKRVRTKFMPKS
jgi:predicted transcriptional regulator